MTLAWAFACAVCSALNTYTYVQDHDPTSLGVAVFTGLAAIILGSRS